MTGLCFNANYPLDLLVLIDGKWKCITVETSLENCSIFVIVSSYISENLFCCVFIGQFGGTYRI